MADTKTSPKKEAIERKSDGTIVLNIHLSKESIAKTKESVIASMVAHAKIDGFREGKAPREIVEPRLDPMKIQEEILKTLIPDAYLEAVKTHQLKPIINPKIHVEKIDEGSDWTFSATTCEMPVLTLSDYKKAIQKLTAGSKIVIPGKEDQQKKAPSFEEIAKTLLDHVKGDIPSILVESEADRLLSQLLTEIKTLGLSLEQYLSSTKKTAEDLRAEYATKAKHDLMLEFALAKVAEEEKISVDPKELEEAFATAKSPQEKEQLQKNAYLLTSILRQQKTLDYLKNL